MRVPLLFYTRASNNLGKALGEGLGLLCVPFTSLSLSLSLTLSFTLSLSFTLFLSYLSLPLYFSPCTFLSLSLLSIIFFGVSNGRFRPCLYILMLLCIYDFNSVFLSTYNASLITVFLFMYNISAFFAFSFWWQQYYFRRVYFEFYDSSSYNILIYQIIVSFFLL